MSRHALFTVRTISSLALPCAFGVCALVAGASAARAEPPAVAPRVQPPIVLEENRPAYPAEALTTRPSGEVSVTATVSPAGEVSAVELAQEIAPALDRAALDAATRWRFRPATRDGVPVPSRVQLLFHFEPPPVVAPAGGPATSPVAAPPGAVSTTLPTSTPGLPALPEVAPSPAPKPGEVSAIDVSVRGRRQQEANRGASDLEIEVGQLAVIANQKASDILQLAPGIFIANEGGSGHADQVFLRGFDAEQGQAIEFTVNGVPINEVDNTDGHGYADTHFIIPELVKNLRVIEGPFSPRQGDFAEAGSADYQLGVPDRRLELSASYSNT